MMRIYLDHNATTPVAPEVADAMAQALRTTFGNPSSVHTDGQQAKTALDEARSAVARLLGAEPTEIVFTSGGSEADNLAIRGAAEALAGSRRRHLVASAIEHEAVLQTLKALAKQGWTTTLVGVDASGVVTPERVAEAMTDHTALVSVMHANNEIGTIQPVA
ncbi:MAG: aminotransferase class V-fold PLP-dependent enzyme, partial [Vicinamibacterales bacterium]|nr:aminotransferase class V-fold PLP-dependent enzyme [Vicinamibacterales bacterium]